MGRSIISWTVVGLLGAFGVVRALQDPVGLDVLTQADATAINVVRGEVLERRNEELVVGVWDNLDSGSLAASGQLTVTTRRDACPVEEGLEVVLVVEGAPPASLRIATLPRVGSGCFTAADAAQQIIEGARTAGAASSESLAGVLAAAIDALRSDDPPSERLAAAELLRRPDLLAALKPRDQLLLSSVVLAGIDDRAHLTLLEAVQRSVGLVGEGLVLTVLRHALARLDVQVPAGDPAVELLRRSAEIAGGIGQQPDYPTLARWVRSNRYEIGVQAVRSMAKLDLTLTEVIARQAVYDFALPSQTRAALQEIVDAADARDDADTQEP